MLKILRYEAEGVFFRVGKGMYSSVASGKKYAYWRCLFFYRLCYQYFFARIFLAFSLPGLGVSENYQSPGELWGD